MPKPPTTTTSNVVVIEVGTRGCTNRWAHKLLGRFTWLSRQHSGQACLDALCVCTCEFVCMCIITLDRTGEEQICLISFLITYGSSSIRTRHSQLPHLPTHSYTQTHTSLSKTTKVDRTHCSCYSPYVSQQQGFAPLRCIVISLPVCARDENIAL